MGDIKFYSPVDFDDTSSGVTIEGELNVNDAAYFYDSTQTENLRITGSVITGSRNGQTSYSNNIDFGTNTMAIRTRSGVQIYVNGNAILSVLENYINLDKNTSIGAGINPSARLHIKGSGTTSATDALLVENSYGTDLLTVEDGGNTGIGMDPVNNRKLAVAGTILVDASDGQSGIMFLRPSDSATMGVLSAPSSGVLKIGGGNQSNVQIYAHVTHVATFNSSGNVGIGVTSPTQKLHVDGNARITGAIYDSNNEPGTSGQILSSTVTGTDWVNQGDVVAGSADKALSVTLTVKNTETIALTKGQVVCAAPSATPPSGNIIEVKLADNNGTDSMPAIGVLNEGLDAAGGANDEGEAIMFGKVSGIDTSVFAVGDEVYVSDTPGGLTATKPTGVKYIQKIGVVIRDDASNGTIEIFGAGRTNDVPTPLYIDHANQRVGIGVTSPTQKLEIDGNIKLASYGQSIYFGSTVNEIKGSSSDFLYKSFSRTQFDNAGTYADSSYVFKQGGSEVFRIHTGGNVGIGTATPGAKLEVDGNIWLNNSSVYTGTLKIEHNANNTFRFTNTGIGTFMTVGSSNVVEINNQQLRSLGRGAYFDNTISGNPLQVGTSGDGLTVLNSGSNYDVGININTPTAKLHLVGNGATSATSSLLAQNSSGTEIFRVRDDGSVYGIGAGGIDTNTAYGKDAFINNTSGAYNTAIGYDALFTNGSGNYNIAMGWQSLNNNTSGSENFALGVNSLRYNTTGSFNVAIGTTALTINSTGTYNVAIGKEALRNNTASNNVAIGYQSLFSNTSGTENVSVGTYALQQNTTAANNVAVGYQAAKNTTSAVKLTAIGSNALKDNTTGNSNIAVGYFSLYRNTTGADNVSVGTHSLIENTTGSKNAALGHDSLRYNTASENTAVGYQALYNNTTAGGNTAVGNKSLINNTTGFANVSVGSLSSISLASGSYNTVVGQAAYRYSTGSQNTAIGQAALQNSTASNNTAVGFEALKDNTAGTHNVAIGRGALDANTTASNNTAIGTYALTTNTTGTHNTAVGEDSLFFNSTGTGNTGIGGGALRTNTASNNTAVGYNAAYSNTTGASNSALGQSALYTNTTGTRNNAFGAGALRYLNGGTGNVGFGNETFRSTTTGSYNVGIGDYAGYYNTTASNNIAIGYRSNFINTTGANNVAIGASALYDNTASNNTAVGHNALTNNTTATANTALGSEAGLNVTTGGSNVFLGKAAGRGQTTGQLNIAIGVNALYSSGTGNSNVAIGFYNQFSHTNASQNVSIGIQAIQYNTTGSDNVVIGHAAAQGTSGTSIGSNNIVLGRNAVTGGFNSSVILGRAATATADNQFVVGSSSYNAGAITPAPPGLTANFVWDVVINGVPYQILLA